MPDAPGELRPALDAINGLFGRVATAREREKSFTAFTAHELKTPLAGLKTHAQIALALEDPKTSRHALKQVVSGVDQSSRLVRQLLDLAAADANEERETAGSTDPSSSGAMPSSRSNRSLRAAMSPSKCKAIPG